MYLLSNICVTHRLNIALKSDFLSQYSIGYQCNSRGNIHGRRNKINAKANGYEKIVDEIWDVFIINFTIVIIVIILKYVKWEYLFLSSKVILKYLSKIYWDFHDVTPY